MKGRWPSAVKLVNPKVCSSWKAVNKQIQKMIKKETSELCVLSKSHSKFKQDGYSLISQSSKSTRDTILQMSYEENISGTLVGNLKCFLIQRGFAEPVYSLALYSAMVVGSTFCTAIFGLPFLFLENCSPKYLEGSIPTKEGCCTISPSLFLNRDF